MEVSMMKTGEAVRVVLPATVAYDLNRFSKSIASLAERLGCRHCLSGVACRFQLERDFVVDPAGRVLADPSPQPNVFAGLDALGEPMLVVRL